MTHATYILLFLLVFSLTFNVLVLFRFLWVKESARRRLLMRLALFAFSFLFTFMVIEGVFRFFVIQSDSWGFTLAGKQWFRKHWHPLNARGFRDIEHSPATLQGKKIVLVIGDSFVTGYGIKDVSDRYSDILRARLGGQWAVINLAKNGWNTAEELEAFKAFPIKPDHVVLSYYLNDIQPIAFRFPQFDPGQFESPIRKPPPLLIRSLVDNSYFIDFVYWRLYRFRGIFEDQKYKDYIIDLFS
ncbi:SGNH/GDSL hydrolase family protein, partial [Acidobacteriota bacterium]